MKIEWNRVTKFSKGLAFVLFIALPVIAFLFGAKYGELKSISNETREYFREARLNLAVKSIVNPAPSPIIEEKICSNSETLNSFPKEVAILNNTPILGNEFPWMQTVPTLDSSAISPQGTKYNDIVLCGKEWVVYMPADTDAEIISLTNKFNNFVNKFVSNGWETVVVNSVGYKVVGSAGGGISSDSNGYLKATDNLIRAVVLEDSVSTMGQPDYNCPCIKEFRVFISDIIPIKEVAQTR